MAAPPRRSCRRPHAESIIGPSPLRNFITADPVALPSVKSISKQFAELSVQDDAKLDQIADAVDADLSCLRHPVVAGIVIVNVIAFVCVVLLLQFELFLAPKMAAFVVLRITALDLIVCAVLVYRYIWYRPQPINK